MYGSVHSALEADSRMCYYPAGCGKTCLFRLNTAGERVFIVSPPRINSGKKAGHARLHGGPPLGGTCPIVPQLICSQDITECQNPDYLVNRELASDVKKVGVDLSVHCWYFVALIKSSWKWKLCCCFFLIMFWLTINKGLFDHSSHI